MSDTYEGYLLQVKLSSGIKTLGMFAESKSHKSNIVCMICKNFFAKDEEELCRHIVRAHPEIFEQKPKTAT
jgi:hypothetical protein